MKILFTALLLDGTAKTHKLSFGGSRKSGIRRFSTAAAEGSRLKLPNSVFFAIHPKSGIVTFVSTILLLLTCTFSYADQPSSAVPQTHAVTTTSYAQIPEAPAETAAGFWGVCKESLYNNFVEGDRWRYLTDGFAVTLEVSAGATILGLILGFLIAVIRSAADTTGKIPVLNMLCRIYLTVIRGTPTVVQLLIVYFVIFGSCNIDKVTVAIIAFGVNSGAYVAEIVRSGIASIDRGQLEASRSLGMSYPQAMAFVILPQAFKNVLPALGNEFIVLLKETSVAGYIALQDLTKGGDIIRSQTYDAFLPLFAVAGIYLAVVMLFSCLLTRLEKRLKKNE